MENVELLAESDPRNLIRKGYSLEYVFDKIHSRNKIKNKDIDDFSFCDLVSVPEAPPNIKDDKEASIIYYLELRSVFLQLEERRKRMDALFDQKVH